MGPRPVVPTIERKPTQGSDETRPYTDLPYADAVNVTRAPDVTDTSESPVFLKSLVKEMREGFLYQGQQIQQLMKALLQRDTSSPVKTLTMDHSGIMPDYMMLPAERMGELQPMNPLAHRSQRSFY